MRWPWRHKHQTEMAVVDVLDGDVITPDNPMYTVLMSAIATGKPVVAIYDRHTGEILESRTLE